MYKIGEYKFSVSRPTLGVLKKLAKVIKPFTDDPTFSLGKVLSSVSEQATSFFVILLIPEEGQSYTSLSEEGKQAYLDTHLDYDDAVKIANDFLACSPLASHIKELLDRLTNRLLSGQSSQNT